MRTELADELRLAIVQKPMPEGLVNTIGVHLSCKQVSRAKLMTMFELYMAHYRLRVTRGFKDGTRAAHIVVDNQVTLVGTRPTRVKVRMRLGSQGPFGKLEGRNHTREDPSADFHA